jgi:hypothetical protein
MISGGIGELESFAGTAKFGLKVCGRGISAIFPNARYKTSVGRVWVYIGSEKCESFFESHIGAQGLFLSIAGNPALPCSGYKSEDSNNYSGLFKPCVLSFFGLGLLASGCWILILGATTLTNWLLGIAMLVAGFAIQQEYPLPLIISIAENANASHGSFGVSATRYRGTENIWVAPIVIAPFKFRNVQWQVLAADFVETAHNPTFQQRPKAVDSLGVDRAIDILASAVPNCAVFLQFAICGMIVSRDQADIFRNGFADETIQSCGISVRDDAGHDVALALNGANNGILAFSASPRRPLIPMPISVLSADIGFINFDNAHELAEFRLGEPGANAVAHVMRGSIRTEAEHPLYLQGAYTLLAGKHQIDDFEPSPQRNIGVFEDRSDQDGKAVSLRSAGWAFPFEGHSFQCVYAVAPAVWAMDAGRPAARNEIRFASIIVGEQFIKLSDGHLLGEFWGGHESDLRV